MKSKWFRYGFLIFFFIMFFQMLWNTYLVFAGAAADDDYLHVNASFPFFALQMSCVMVPIGQ